MNEKQKKKILNGNSIPVRLKLTAFAFYFQNDFTQWKSRSFHHYLSLFKTAPFRNNERFSEYVKLYP